MSKDSEKVSYSWQDRQRAYLLDSCTLIWAVANVQQLSNQARKLIEDTDNRLYVSAASAYEISYKNQLDKLGEYKIIAEEYEAILRTLGVHELPISQKHALNAGALNSKHRDPFDRIIACQSILEQIQVITNDKDLCSIAGVKSVW